MIKRAKKTPFFDPQAPSLEHFEAEISQFLNGFKKNAVTIEIPGIPRPWIHHSGYGKCSYDKRGPLKASIRLLIKSQYKGPLLQGPLRLDAVFHLPIPKNVSKKSRAYMIAGSILPCKRPDRTNYLKLYEDCLSGIVFVDDGQVCQGETTKRYSLTPKTFLCIQQIDCAE